MSNSLFVRRHSLVECGGRLLTAIGPYLDVHDVRVTAKTTFVSRILVFNDREVHVDGIVPIFDTGFVVVYGGCRLTIVHKKELCGGDTVIPSSRIYHSECRILSVHPLRNGNDVQYALMLEGRMVRLCDFIIEDDILLMPFHLDKRIKEDYDITAYTVSGTTWEEMEVMIATSLRTLLFWKPGRPDLCNSTGFAFGDKNSPAVTHLFRADRFLVVFSPPQNLLILDLPKLFQHSAGDESPANWFQVPKLVPASFAFSRNTLRLYASDTTGHIYTYRLGEGASTMAVVYAYTPHLGEITSMYANEGVGRLFYTTATGAFHSILYANLYTNETELLLDVDVKHFAVCKGIGEEKANFFGIFEYGDEMFVGTIQKKTNEFALDVEFDQFVTREEIGFTVAMAYERQKIVIHSYCDSERREMAVGDIRKYPITVTDKVEGSDEIVSATIAPPFVVVALKSEEVMFWPFDRCNRSPGVTGRVSLKKARLAGGYKKPFKLTAGCTVENEFSETRTENRILLGTEEGVVVLLTAYFVFDQKEDARLLQTDNIGVKLAKSLAVSSTMGGVPIVYLQANSNACTCHQECDDHRTVWGLNERGTEFLVDVQTGYMLTERTYSHMFPSFLPRFYVYSPTKERFEYLAGVRNKCEFVLISRDTLKEVFCYVFWEPISHISCMVEEGDENVSVYFRRSETSNIVIVTGRLANKGLREIIKFEQPEGITSFIPLCEKSMMGMCSTNGLLRMFDFNKKGEMSAPPSVSFGKNIFYQPDQTVTRPWRDGCIMAILTGEALLHFMKVQKVNGRGQFHFSIPFEVKYKVEGFALSEEKANGTQMPILVVLCPGGRITGFYIDESSLSVSLAFQVILPINAKITTLCCSTRDGKDIRVWAASAIGILGQANISEAPTPFTAIPMAHFIDFTSIHAMCLVMGAYKKDVAVMGRRDGMIAWRPDDVNAHARTMSVHSGEVKALVSHDLSGYDGRFSLIASLAEDNAVALLAYDNRQIKMHLLSKMALNVPNARIISFGSCNIKSTVYVVVAGDGVEVVGFCRKKVGPCALKKIANDSATDTTKD